MSFEEFRQLISNITGIPLKDIHEHSSFRDDLAIDSLQMVNLIIEVTGKLQTNLQSVKSLEEFSTVKSMYETFKRSEQHEESC